VKVLVGDRLSYGKSPARFRLPGERALIAAIAIAFLILHIFFRHDLTARRDR
jgi:hypothetical protein